MVSPSDWDRIRALFNAALERAPEERVRFLRAQNCSREVRREVASLLLAHAEAEALLQGAGRGDAGASGRRASRDGSGSEGASATLPSGARLGPYVVVSLLGAGGMGEVYRARDTNLRRDVALKILPGRLAADRDRLARFTHEARTLASLNHPNVAQVHGFEEHDGRWALVMELVEGEDLAARLRRGPIPAEEALSIARYIAAALEAAHAQGIIHRDLKPANVMVRSDGAVKVLDLGLAKALDRPGAPPPHAGAGSTTSAQPATEVGAIVGTAPYMAPEQVRGSGVDRSTDIWAFGCVLYEMLTGTRAFDGSDGADTLAAVLERDPEWERLPTATPPAIRVLLRRCLRKDRRERLQDAAGVRIELDDLLQDRHGRTLTLVPDARVGRGWRQWLVAGPALVAGALAAGAAGWHLRPTTPLREAAVARATLPAPVGENFFLPLPGVAVSPDGTQLVFVTVRNGLQQLYRRPIGQLEATVLPGTEGATVPFFSPDSQWVAFFADGKLKKVPVMGGAAQVLCEARSGYGGGWSSDGVIYFSPGPMSALWQVSADGGTPDPFTVLQPGEITHRWPQVLPGGHAVLFTSGTGPGADERQVHVQRVADGARRALVRGDTGTYVSSGHLVYVQVATGTLVGVPFDATRLEVTTGPAVTLATGVLAGDEGAHYAVSDAGVLTYLTGRSDFASGTLVWVDRSGRAEPVQAPSRPYHVPRLSPDGTRVAFMTHGPKYEVWVHDFARGDATKLISDGSDQYPIWTPDGRRLAYGGTRAGTRSIFWRNVDGRRTEERLTQSSRNDAPGSWSPDGQTLLFTSVADDADLLALSLPERRVQPYLQTRFLEAAPQFSPDGRWVAYRSDESGRSEVYVRPYPAGDGKWQVSTDGGAEAVWNPNGRELFYRNGPTMMAVAIAPSATFRAGEPTPLFTARYVPATTSTTFPNYDVSRDGRRFLMVQPDTPRAPTEMVVVLNWGQELKRLVPAD